MSEDRGTRDVILRAALGCVADGDWDLTSMSAVQQRAGVSNGSLFHHFRTRRELTAAVVDKALGDHQEQLLVELSDDAERGVTGVVRRHLRWVDDNRDTARLLLGTPPDVLRRSVSTPALDDNRRFFAGVTGWLEGHGWGGDPELTVVLALWIGPAQEFGRQRLATDGVVFDGAAADALAAGAWAALRPLLARPTERARA